MSSASYGGLACSCLDRVARGKLPHHPHNGRLHSPLLRPWHFPRLAIHHTVVQPRMRTKRRLLVSCTRAHDGDDAKDSVCNDKDEVNGLKFRSVWVALSKVYVVTLRVVSNNFLTSVLLCGFFFGLGYPTLGQLAYQSGLSKWATFGVFFFSGLTLHTSELGEALGAWPSLAFGLTSVLFLTPLMALLVLQVHLVPHELVTGLAIFCCVPTTLSSGVALTQVAGANTAVALSLTILSNILGILTMPFMITNLVAHGIGVSLPAWSLMKSLFETLVIPLIIGKVVREILPGMPSFIDKHKVQCSQLSSLCLGLVPWMQASCSRSLLLSLRAWNLAAALTLGMAIHIGFFIWHFWGMYLLQLLTKSTDSHQKRITWAIILTASQKTLPILVSVVAGLQGMMGDAGLLVLPCVAAHINQIIIDSMLVKLWIQGDLREV